MTDKLIELAQKNWHKPVGLIFSVGAAILFEIILLNSLDATVIVAGTVYIITSFVVPGIWFYSNRYPKTPDGKVGFVVSIECSTEEETKKIREDFVDTLRKLLKNGALGNIFISLKSLNILLKKLKTMMMP